MGACLSSDKNEKCLIPEQPESIQGEIADYTLRKTRAGCSGMFWRCDPTGQTQLIDNASWPRDGATIRGETIVVNEEKWLKAYQVRQANAFNGQWEQAPVGAYLPFAYDNHYYLEKVMPG